VLTESRLLSVARRQRAITSGVWRSGEAYRDPSSEAYRDPSSEAYRDPSSEAVQGSVK
jgi:hypothetical protein